MESKLTQRSDGDGEHEPGSAPPSTAPAALGEVVANVGSRIQEILDTAERVAGDIRAEAEAAGASYLDERRREADRAVEDRVRQFDTLTQALSLRVESLQREAAALVDALGEARQALGGLAEAPPPRAPASPTPPEPPEPGSLRPQAVAHPEPTDTDERMSEQAVLRATQMAVAGTERTEIERMLRIEFGVKDPAAVVDQMLRSERA